MESGGRSEYEPPSRNPKHRITITDDFDFEAEMQKRRDMKAQEEEKNMKVAERRKALDDAWKVSDGDCDVAAIVKFSERHQEYVLAIWAQALALEFSFGFPPLPSGSHDAW